MMRDRIAWLALLMLAFPVASRAGGVSGSKPMLCAVTDARDCSHDADCVSAAPEELNLPPFLVVDAKAKQISEYQGERKSPVQTVLEKDGNVVLQGYEERAWSMVISKETGKLLSVGTGGPDGAFVVSGICTDL
jgi:hypothetical protein